MQTLHERMVDGEPLAEAPQPLEQADVDTELCTRLCGAAPAELDVAGDKGRALAAALAGVEGCAVTGDTRPGILEYHSAYLSVLLPSHC